MRGVPDEALLFAAGCNDGIALGFPGLGGATFCAVGISPFFSGLVSHGTKDQWTNTSRELNLPITVQLVELSLLNSRPKTRPSLVGLVRRWRPRGAHMD